MTDHKSPTHAAVPSSADTITIPIDEWAELKKCGASDITITKDDYIDLLRTNLAFWRGSRTTPKVPHATSDENVAKIRQLHAQGSSTREIEQLTGVSRNTVHEIVTQKTRA